MFNHRAIGFFFSFLLGAAGLAAGAELHREVPAPGSYAHAALKPVPLFSVKLSDNFWKPRIETNINKGWFDLEEKFDKNGHFEPFRILVEKRAVASPKRPNNDEFVYKWMEAGGFYSAYPEGGPACQRISDELHKTIDLVLSIQAPDGYINSFYSNPNAVDVGLGTTPFNREGHYEFYDWGHLTQAAIAQYRATGERRFLDAAIRFADLIVAKFGAPNHLPYRMNREAINMRVEHPNHELAMVELSRVTGDERYRDFTQHTLDEYNYWARWQIDGHGVREALLNTAAVDLYLEDGNKAQLATPIRLWQDMVNGRMYLHGGIGSRRGGEAFGDKFELPNDAYAETCAAISSFFWSHKLLLATGDAKYADQMERLLYNGIIAGISLSGTEYCYRNPLTVDSTRPVEERGAPRKPWFGVPCCPPNVSRLFASLGDYFYSTRPDGVAVNLYGANTATIPVAGQPVGFTQATSYPWDGRITIKVAPRAPVKFSLSLRVPGWVEGHPVASDLYRYLNDESEPVRITINGTPHTGKPENGFVTISREWKSGDKVRLELPMTIRRVLAHESVLNLRGLVALERGPVMFCVETPDNGGAVRNLILPDAAPLEAQFRADLLGGVTVLRGANLTAIPYAVWNNRGFADMTVWMPREEGKSAF